MFRVKYSFVPTNFTNGKLVWGEIMTFEWKFKRGIKKSDLDTSKKLRGKETQR